MKKFPSQLIPPILIVMFLDLVFTLAGQPKTYWSDFSLPREGSPFGFALLAKHPTFFIVAFFIYLAVVYVLLKKLPIKISTVLALSLFLGHAWGSSSWLPTLYKKFGFEVFPNYHWWLIVSYFVLLSVFSTYFFFKKTTSVNKNLEI